MEWWILFHLGLGLFSWVSDVIKTNQEAVDLGSAAEEKAAYERKVAAQQLTDDIGQLGGEYETYEDWKDAQRAEWEAAGSPGDFQEYLRSEQLVELGQYGRQRAQLESDVAYAEEQLGQARVDTQLAYEFGLREHQAGTDESNRTLRAEAQAAAASGFRSGTPQDTVRENLRVRNEALQLYLDRITASRDSNLQKIDRGERQLQSNFDIGLANLDAAVSGARSGYDLNIEGINLDLTQYKEGLADRFHDVFSVGGFFNSLINGASAAASVFQTGLSVGAWGWDKQGSLWYAWDRPSVSPTPGLPSGGGGIPSLLTPTL